jgi:hypothetical protein
MRLCFDWIYQAKVLESKATRLALLIFAMVGCWSVPAVLLGAPAISYVQGAYATPQSPQASVSVRFNSAQTAGNLNVIAVGWNDSTAIVSSVTDKSGNVYTRAVGPTVVSGVASQSIYYAKNIVAAAAGTNSVTVNFSSAAGYPDIRILEYSGADPNNPIDVTAANSGNSSASSSGSATTTNATDLLFGANLVLTTTSGAGSGFSKRLLTSPDGDIAEDRMVSGMGSYSATAPLSSGRWIMQMVAFRTPSGGINVPTVTGVSPNTGSTAGGTSVTITGTNFATGATVKFGSTAATNVVVVSGTSITATTPAGSAGPVTVTVTVEGQSGSLVSGLTYIGAPTVTSVSPSSGTTAGGTAVTISGANFGNGATVRFGSAAATNVVVTGSTSITATTPAGSAGAATVTVTVSGQSGSLTSGFTYAVVPTVTGVSPNTGTTAGGTAVTITGSNFASGATVKFGSTAATNVVVVSSTSITATNPAGTVGRVTVTATVSGQSGSLANGFTYVAAPTVMSVSPNNGSTAGGTTVTISGANFATGAMVTFGSTAATNVVVVNSTTITATTPAFSASAVTVTVTLSGQSGSLANGFTYAATPTVTSVSPNSGLTAGGTNVTISGTNFATGATVTFGSTAATDVVAVNSTTITATTPAFSAGSVMVTVMNPDPQSGTLANAFTYVSSNTITYIQGAYATPQSSSSTVNVTFTAAQAAGNLNVVVVGWNDSSATVSTVADKSGNQYALAVGPTVLAPVASQSIYYARNIAAAGPGANVVTVTFSKAAVSPDIRILEYSGADPNNPVDVTAASSGNSATSSSRSVSTTNANDLIFGANLVQTTTSGPGGGFTSRLLTSPDGDIAEDEMVTSISSYSATAPLSSGLWIMQMVAFRTPVSGGGGDTTPPTVPTNLTAAVSGTQINLSWNASTDNVGVTGYLVDRCQGAGCSNFAQIASVTTTTYGDKSLAAGTYTYRVRATDAAGNLSNYSNQPTATVATSLTVTPHAVALTFTRTQQFTVNNGNVVWSVDGLAGGSASTGAINTAGLYTPPNTAGTHTVTATTSDQSLSGSATVYITNYEGTFTFHNDNLRSGLNSNETVLTPSNINLSQFGKLFSYPVDGLAFASPLYAANVSIPGTGFHNVVYVATEHDSVYAFDADGLTTTPLWQVSFLQNGATPVPCGDTGECGDIPSEIGITSTPVIDPSSQTLYLVAKTKEGTNYVQRLHALDITTGAEKFGGPVVIQASVPGEGDGTNAVSFNPLRENQRTGLLLNNGGVYLGFGAHGDNGTYYGWILGYSATTLQQVMAYNSSPNATQGGIWQSGAGLATDATGNIFFTSGNGAFDANTGGVDYGDTVIKLSTQGTVVDYFTPHDQANLASQDLDLSSAGPTLLVDQAGSYPHVLITAGKGGTIYVINRENMGHYNANSDNQIIQSLPNVLLHSNLDNGNFSSPVFFNGFAYFSAVSDHLKAFQMTNGLLSAAPSSQSAAVFSNRGGSFAISANGASNGILWVMQDNAPNNPSNGVLIAYDAGNLTNEFYDTSQAGSRDALDVANKFSIPLVANGKVFVVSQTHLIAYGLLP